MASEQEIIELIEQIGIVPVVVLEDEKDAEPLADALKEGGLPCAEVTFRTEAAESAIRLMLKKYPAMVVGAGTVLTVAQAERAVRAGARFIVSPGYGEEVVNYCIKNNIVVIPGVSSASDIQRAIGAGLKVVKFFPAEASGGLDMIKALAAPYKNIKFMPTGGINVNNLEYLDLGDSDKIKVAEQVYAIGNPIGFEFQRTVTSGIISGLNRTIKIEEDNKTSYMEDLIQTDATINPGNSGGPLININGEVLGINSVKITSAEGIGFAIPINIIKPIIEKLTNTGECITPSLGVFAYDKNIVPYINQELDQNIKLDKGIYIADVTKNSPAEKVGVKRGDILLEIDGIELEKMSELRTYIYRKNVGEKVNIKLVRSNKEYQISVTLAKK